MLFLLSLVVQLEVGRENPDQQIQYDEPAFERHDSHPYQRLLSHWRRPRESTLREIPEDSSDNDYEAFSIPSSKSVDSSRRSTDSGVYTKPSRSSSDYESFSMPRLTPGKYEMYSSRVSSRKYEIYAAKN